MPGISFTIHFPFLLVPVRRSSDTSFLSFLFLCVNKFTRFLFRPLSISRHERSPCPAFSLTYALSFCLCIYSHYAALPLFALVVRLLRRKHSFFPVLSENTWYSVSVFSLWPSPPSFPSLPSFSLVTYRNLWDWFSVSVLTNGTHLQQKKARRSLLYAVISRLTCTIFFAPRAWLFYLLYRFL